MFSSLSISSNQKFIALSSYIVNHVETSCFLDIFELNSLQNIKHNKQAKLVSKKTLNEDDYFHFLDFGFERKNQNISILLGFTSLTNNLISFYYSGSELAKVTGKMKLGESFVVEVMRKNGVLLLRAMDGSVGVLGIRDLEYLE